jgi:hypothetical protein
MKMQECDDAANKFFFSLSYDCSTSSVARPTDTAYLSQFASVIVAYNSRAVTPTRGGVNATNKEPHRP